MRRFLTLAVVVVLLLGGLGAWLMWRTLHRVEQAATLTKEEEQIDLGSVVTRVRSLARLETASMHVANVSTLKQGYNLLPDKLAGDTITLYAAGDVIAGIDLSTIQQRDVRRGPYGGAVAYFGFSGNLDSCITIRTIVLAKGSAYIEAGAGIVYDSDPATEYDETLNKAKALMNAVSVAKALRQRVADAEHSEAKGPL